MRKLIGILIFSASLSAPALAQDKLVAAPMTAQELVQQFMFCSAIMQLNGENPVIREDAKLYADVQASAERHRKSAAYYLRGAMDVDSLNNYVQGGIAEAHAKLQADLNEKGGTEIDKRMGQCNTPEMLSRGFEAHQALAEAEAQAAMVSTANAPPPVAPKPMPPVVTTTIITNTPQAGADDKSIPITVKNAPEPEKPASAKKTEKKK